MATPMGLLVAGFNFQAVAEDEFNDWYDTEHVPQRERIKGFVNCERWLGTDHPKVSIATSNGGLIIGKTIIYSVTH